MKTIYLISVLLLFGQFCLAQEYVFDKKHKLSYEEFINQYGTDDTSIAIIDLYFDKHDYSATGQMSFLPVSAAIVVVAPPIGVSLMVISSPLFVNGLITSNKYSRKKLLKTLNNYHNNQMLSNKNKRKVTKLIEAQKEMYIEDYLEARTNYIYY